MNELYGQTCSCCHHANPRNEASVSASFTPELMARLLADIFARKFNVEDEIWPELYEACRDTFRRALDEGYPLPEDADDAETLFREALRSDADVFAAFRTHRMQNDIASQLLDENGKLKEFRRFQEDAESVISTYNNHWLRTEYDTAVLRARYAADWKRFSRNADILPNLKWMPTTSADPDVFHMEYWRIGLTLPKTHPFWKNHHPHDRWGCKCDLEETDDPVTGIIPEVDYKPSPGLENNPGLEPELFSHTHPYYEKAYPGAEKAVERLMAGEGIQDIIRRLEKSYPKGDAVRIGRLADDVKEFVRKKGIEPLTDEIYMTDKQIHHSLRRVKQKAGKAVTAEQLAALPSLMNDCEVYWDEKAGNIQFITRQDGKVQKFVVSLNYAAKIQGEKKTVNAFITAGTIEERNLGMKNLVKIK
nr:MAG TPA: minor capsid component [Caudoviricetes sp.]